MTYLIVRRSARDAGATALRRVIAQGETVVLEGPWPLGETIIARVDDAELGALRADKAGFDRYAVEALAEPGAGEAFVIAAHRMRDTAGFGPYAERVGEVVSSFGGRFLARAGKVTPLGGAFVPDRAVIIEFPTAADAVAFYVSDVYAPLLTIRHATTDPRFVVVARAGPLPAAARSAAESYLRSHPASSH
jgi:uncharacterized protein (DUF1330 family)